MQFKQLFLSIKTSLYPDTDDFLFSLTNDAIGSTIETIPAEPGEFLLQVTPDQCYYTLGTDEWCYVFSPYYGHTHWDNWLLNRGQFHAVLWVMPCQGQYRGGPQLRPEPFRWSAWGFR